MVYFKQNNNMNSLGSFSDMERPQRWFTLALDKFSVNDLENWSDIEQALKERKKALQLEARQIKSKEKALQKEREREAKKIAKASEKLTAKQKDQTPKTLKSLQSIIMRGVKKEAKTNKPKAPSFNNYSSWTSGIKGQDNACPGAPTQEELDSCGGRREWKKIEWAKLTKEQKDDPDAPWNTYKAH